jgi:hypothetical protein
MCRTFDHHLHRASGDLGQLPSVRARQTARGRSRRPEIPAAIRRLRKADVVFLEDLAMSSKYSYRKFCLWFFTIHWQDRTAAADDSGDRLVVTECTGQNAA